MARCGGAAQFECGPHARAIAPGAATLRFRHQPPDALDEAPAAFGAPLGPFDVALGRRVGQHEPADRVGAVSVDDRLSGAITFFFDFDIFSDGPMVTGSRCP
jgi:hypothetical protein